MFFQTCSLSPFVIFTSCMLHKVMQRQTAGNNMQLDSVCKRTQHVTSNNVASVCKWFKSFYNWEFRRTPLETENLNISIMK